MALDNLQGFDNILGLLAGFDAFFFGSEDGETFDSLFVSPHIHKLYTPVLMLDNNFFQFKE